ncbi:hypothetical protein GLW08_04355 [Pontibacillus yanchengensis]|uniref:Uncharacterized protein n=2 Tax=Pontibacillus yanchengensis TaxID=462910 RepID=A0ACC7VD15_9BACI|nr:hypothetical protein [Pontibacillus yanchengensis]MYL31988.1 hypothetical protein [Pontibacillus yanchengensis]MYL52565.1 hypothetical protein [Pontibacillus yanchengensis]
MRVLLELLRIICIFGILAGVLGGMLDAFYDAFVGTEATAYQWLGYVGVLVFLFVLYRNHWQFSGWYKGKAREKLSNLVTRMLVRTSIILVIAPTFIDVIRR